MITGDYVTGLVGGTSAKSFTFAWQQTLYARGPVMAHGVIAYGVAYKNIVILGVPR